MKLTELNPSFVGSGGEGVSDSEGKPVPERHGVGISFDCPCGCKLPCFVCFENPLDGGLSVNGDRHTWKREGDNFEVLTLTPSILRVKWKDNTGKEHGCGWHGFITNGKIITV